MWKHSLVFVCDVRGWFAVFQYLLGEECLMFRDASMTAGTGPVKNSLSVQWAQTQIQGGRENQRGKLLLEFFRVNQGLM